MNLELTGKEKNTLVDVLQDYIPELRGEIAASAKRDFRLELKEEETVLRGILKKLESLN